MLFAVISYFALREFLTLTPTRAGDHRAMSVSFFVVLPVQYYLIGIEWYAMFTIFIPVYAYLMLPSLSAVALNLPMDGTIAGSRDGSSRVSLHAAVPSGPPDLVVSRLDPVTGSATAARAKSASPSFRSRFPSSQCSSRSSS